MHSVDQVETERLFTFEIEELMLEETIHMVAVSASSAIGAMPFGVRSAS